jgi:hypothetical protein
MEHFEELNLADPLTFRKTHSSLVTDGVHEM